ncbi:hypothetical protein [Kitasatospora sp. NPDC017646]|uniref:hypothetical protein n=1 Tax=Kitasatospora sp. NPDC017646 TaxID=3364024 RepID=UPI0037937205
MLTPVVAFYGVTAVACATLHRPAATAFGLFGLASSVLVLYWIARSLDRDADRRVQRWLAAHDAARVDEIASGTGLRPTTVRLSLARLTVSGAVVARAEAAVYRIAG